jgi:glycerophosphoryl diester phosphodiesterase
MLTSRGTVNAKADIRSPEEVPGAVSTSTDGAVARPRAETAVQAHRGAPDGATGIRENTLAAFDRARRLGADGVELDVRRTADGALAVHHDPVVGELGPLAGLTRGDLPSYVPLLVDVLAACAGLVVNIEIKNVPHEPGFDPDDRAAREVADLVVGAGRSNSVVVSSFWPDTLVAVHEAQPDVHTGLLVAHWFPPDELVPAAIVRGCNAIHPFAALVTPGLVEEAHHEGLAVAAWTVNDRSQLAELAAMGVDTVITDDVALARVVLDEDRPRGS